MPERHAWGVFLDVVEFEALTEPAVIEIVHCRVPSSSWEGTRDAISAHKEKGPVRFAARPFLMKPSELLPNTERRPAGGGGRRCGQELVQVRFHEAIVTGGGRESQLDAKLRRYVDTVRSLE
jgi:hypothetical protein